MTIPRLPRLTLAPVSSVALLVASLACVQVDIGGADGKADATTGDATTGDSTTGDATTGDATTGDSTTGDGDGDGDGDTITALVADALLTDGGPGTAVTSLALSPAGDRIVATLGANRVVVFDLADGASTTVHTIGGGDLFEAGAAVWGSQGFVIGTFSFCLVFDDVGALVHELPDRCSHLVLTDDGQTLIRTTPSSVATVDLASGSVGASAAMVSPAGLGFDGSHVYVLDIPDGYAIEARTLPALDQPQTYALDVRGLFGGPLRGTLAFSSAQLWSDFAAAPVTLATQNLEDQKQLTVSADQRWATTLGFSQGVHVFDAATGAHLAEAGLDTTNANGLVFDASAERLIAGSQAGVQVFTVVRD